jgi:hypothetical protein
MLRKGGSFKMAIEQLSGERLADLAQEAADAIFDAIEDGVDVVHAISMVGVVATDVGRASSATIL